MTHYVGSDLVPRSLVSEAEDEIRSTEKRLKYKSFDCTLFCCKARRKQLKHEGVFLLTSEVFLPFPAYFTTKQSTVSRLLYLFHDKESVKFPMHHFLIFKTNFRRCCDTLAACFILSQSTHLQPNRVGVICGLHHKSTCFIGYSYC